MTQSPKKASPASSQTPFTPDCPAIADEASRRNKFSIFTSITRLLGGKPKKCATDDEQMIIDVENVDAHASNGDSQGEETENRSITDELEPKPSKRRRKTFGRSHSLNSGRNCLGFPSQNLTQSLDRINDDPCRSLNADQSSALYASISTYFTSNHSESISSLDSLSSSTSSMNNLISATSSSIKASHSEDKLTTKMQSLNCNDTNNLPSNESSTNPTEQSKEKTDELPIDLKHFREQVNRVCKNFPLLPSTTPLVTMQSDVESSDSAIYSDDSSSSSSTTSTSTSINSSVQSLVEKLVKDPKFCAEMQAILNEYMKVFAHLSAPQTSTTPTINDILQKAFQHPVNLFPTAAAAIATSDVNYRMPLCPIGLPPDSVNARNQLAIERFYEILNQQIQLAPGDDPFQNGNYNNFTHLNGLGQHQLNMNPSMYANPPVLHPPFNPMPQNYSRNFGPQPNGSYHGASGSSNGTRPTRKRRSDQPSSSSDTLCSSSSANTSSPFLSTGIPFPVPHVNRLPLSTSSSFPNTHPSMMLRNGIQQGPAASLAAFDPRFHSNTQSDQQYRPPRDDFLFY
ncbi:hypothetical protein M3Y94_00279500 [Aphelenchoides besseyi]|nr:hypothetical protein M3Y94_00279500 [Aphelenchoides besseyi]